MDQARKGRLVAAARDRMEYAGVNVPPGGVLELDSDPDCRVAFRRALSAVLTTGQVRERPSDQDKLDPARDVDKFWEIIADGVCNSYKA